MKLINEQNPYTHANQEWNTKYFHTIFLFFFLHFYVTYALQFQFIEQLSGLHRGDTVQGVHELKKYLAYLGFLTPNNRSNDNVFDESLELAIKRYQEFYNLNITGTMDAETTTQIRMPRCGMPDITNNSITRLISRYQFYSGHPRWNTTWLTYAFNRNVKESYKPPLDLAVQEWASATRFKFSRIKYLGQANIRISFMHGNHGDGYSFDGSAAAGLAHTFRRDGRVHFDDAQKWASDGDENSYDLQTIGLHELGHALGLAHCRNEKTIMFPVLVTGERKSMHEDDIKGVKKLYRSLKVE